MMLSLLLGPQKESNDQGDCVCDCRLDPFGLYCSCVIGMYNPLHALYTVTGQQTDSDKEYTRMQKETRQRVVSCVSCCKKLDLSVKSKMFLILCGTWLEEFW